MISARPVRRVARSDKDLRALERVPTAVIPQGADEWRNVVVRKPWGYEFLVFDNGAVGVWMLHIAHNQGTSMHSHPNKHTSLFVLSGTALCNTFHQRSFLGVGEAINIDRGVFHSTKGMSSGGALVLETETPSNKRDLVRLDDRYGRAGTGYEGRDDHIGEELERFRYFQFASGDAPWKVAGEAVRHGPDFSIAFEAYEDVTGFSRHFAADPGALYTVCLGALLDTDGGPGLRVGEVERGSVLASRGGALGIEAPVLLLKTRLFT